MNKTVETQLERDLKVNLPDYKDDTLPCTIKPDVDHTFKMLQQFLTYLVKPKSRLNTDLHELLKSLRFDDSASLNTVRTAMARYQHQLFVTKSQTNIDSHLNQMQVQRSVEYYHSPPLES